MDPLTQKDDRLARRFSISRSLGVGGFGQVFEAFDHVLEANVALKRLSRVDPATIYRFKSEFRSLAGVVHPNLVRLHEFFAVEDEWWFTMELVDGVSFREWVAGPGLGKGGIRVDPMADTLPSKKNREEEVIVRPFDDARLRGALVQLVAGVQALHDAAKLHRDLKPSNVLVTPEGRVVILDFGLVAELEEGRHETLDQRLKGTPAYMPPEQIVGGALTPAADWYAVGVMLYEVLRGKLPFAGNLADIIEHKQSRDAVDPRIGCPELPQDLCDLALELLRRNPAQRPMGRKIARRLGSRPAPMRPTTGTVARTSAGARAAAPFVGWDPLESTCRHASLSIL